MLSICIPSRNEPYLQKTILDILQKATSQIEIIVVLDGYWPPDNEIVEDPRVHYIHFNQAKGMRNAINSAVSLSKGEYILKTDAHCLFAKGFDTQLVKDCHDDWVVVPRRYRLDPEKWLVTGLDRPAIDYMYLAHPDDPSVWGGRSLQGKEWREKNLDTALEKQKIDDLMTFQGSVWMMKRSYYDFLELMDEEHYGQFAKEAQEIGLKAWLSGGKVIVDKNTSYAHWHKTDGRGYSLSNKEFQKGSDYTARWVTEKIWHKQTRDFNWLIEKFSPPGWEGKHD